MTSDKRTRDPAARLKLFGGMLRLGTFSAKELMAHAEVKYETARDFAKDRLKDGTLELIATRHSADEKRGGRPENIYRLDAVHRQRILNEILQVRRSIDISPRTTAGIPSGDSTTEEDFSPLALLETSVSWLAEDNFEDANERRQRLELAHMRLAAAKADLRAMRADRDPRDAVERFTTRLNTAKRALEAEADRNTEDTKKLVEALESEADRTNTATNNEVTEVFSSPLEDQNCKAVMHFLVDWSINIRAALRETRQEFSSDTIDQWLPEIPYTAQRVLLPLYELMQKAADWSRYERSEFGRQIVHRLTALEQIDFDPSMLVSLAISAALVEAVDAAEPLLLTLLRPGVTQAIGTSGSEICALALARLARPGIIPASLPAANACLFLLNREMGNEFIVPVLVPAALQLANADQGTLLNRLAQTLYSGSDVRSRVAEGAVMRNLAWVMQASRYQTLQQYIPDLLGREYGGALLKALISQANGALHLVDRDEGDTFFVSPGLVLANRAGLMDDKVPLAFSKKINDRLAAIRSESNWDEQDRPNQLGYKFTVRLGQPGRPALGLIQGGLK